MSSDHETVYDSETEYSTDGYDDVFDERWFESVGITNTLPLIPVSNIRRMRVATARPKTITPEPTIVDFFRGFVTSVEKGTKRIKGMINHQHSKISKVDDLPYQEVKIIPCTRLELESEMRRVSPSAHSEFLAKVMKSKMHWLVKNHSARNRSFSEANVAALVYEGYVGKYVCVGEGRSTAVWMFDEKWTEISPAEIWQELSTTFLEYIRSFSQYEGDEWETACDDIVKYLSAVVSRERIQRDLLQRLTDNRFQGKLNSVTHLIGMTNGVFDVKKGKLRSALPTDYVSMSTNIPYLDEVDEDRREYLEEILDEIFPNKRIRKFFIQSCASLLEGRNKEKYVYVWWGKGNNGKSMIEKLLASALGDYATVAATSLVTGKRSSADSANPQLSILEGKLSVFLQEPNPTETIKIGMVKELSGGDTITARALFKNNRTFVPKFKLIIVCNAPIEIPNIDVAFTNRLIVIPFESTFRTKEDYRKRKKKGTLTKYDHQMDLSVMKNIPKFGKIFFHMLVEEYKEMDGRPLRVPKRVRKATEDYIMANNFSRRYITECCTEDDEGEIGIKTLHSEMKRWMNEHHGGKKVPNIDIFREEVANIGYDVSSKGIVRGLTADFE